MIAFLFAPENLPFSVALLVMLMIAVVELIGLGGGAVDADVHADGGGAAALLGWLGVGRVPLLMVLVVLLASFGMIGVALQQVAAAMTGAPVSPWIAAPLALAAALPLTGAGVRALARIIPKDETSAIGLDSLIAKRATIVIGSASRGSPARARVKDAYGQAHYVMVEPNDDRGRIGTGETVLLVRREGDMFIGLPEGETLIPRLDDRPRLTHARPGEGQ